MFDYKRVDLTFSLMLWSLCFVDCSGKNFATFSAGEPFTPNRWNLSQVLQCDHFLTGHPNFSRFTVWSTRNETVVFPLSILQHELQENILYSFWTHCSVSDLDDSLLNELWLFPTLAAIFGLDWSAPLENHRKPMWAWPQYSDVQWLDCVSRMLTHPTYSNQPYVWMWCYRTAWTRWGRAMLWSFWVASDLGASTW